MKTKLIFFVLVLTFAALPALGQGVGPVEYVGSAPSGACGNYTPAQFVSPTGTLYTCQSGTWGVAGGSTTNPSSPLSSIQFNNTGGFGGDAALTWDNTNKALTIINTTSGATTGAGIVPALAIGTPLAPPVSPGGIMLTGRASGPAFSAIVEIHNPFAAGINLFTHNNGTAFRSPNINLYTSSGTQTSPTALAHSGFETNLCGQVSFLGYDGTSYGGGNTAPYVGCFTDEAFSSGHRGASIHVYGQNVGGSNQLKFQFGGVDSSGTANIRNITSADLCFNLAGDCILRPVTTFFAFQNPSNSNFLYVKTGNGKATTSADVTCGTSGTLTPCTAFTAITGLTFNLPLIAQNWSFSCDLIVSQATAAAADQIGVQTATNAPTNLAASGVAYTAAAVSTAGAITGVSSTSAQSVITFTPGATGATLPVHISGTIEGASASGMTFNVMVLTGSAADLLTIYRGSECQIY